MTIRMLQVCMLSAFIMSGISEGFSKKTPSPDDYCFKDAQRMGFNTLDPHSRQHIQTGTFIPFKKNAPVLPSSALNALKASWEQKHTSWKNIKAAAQRQGGLKESESIWKLENGRWVKATMDLEKENIFASNKYTDVKKENSTTFFLDLLHEKKAGLEKEYEKMKGRIHGNTFRSQNIHHEKMKEIYTLKKHFETGSVDTLSPNLKHSLQRIVGTDVVYGNALTRKYSTSLNLGSQYKAYNPNLPYIFEEQSRYKKAQALLNHH